MRGAAVAAIEARNYLEKYRYFDHLHYTHINLAVGTPQAMVQMMEMPIFFKVLLCIYRDNGCAARGSACACSIGADEAHLPT